MCSQFDTGTNVSMFMKKTQWAYVIWHQRKYGTGTKSPFFEWRFKAKLIGTDEYLAQYITYVNYNPLKHEIVKNIEIIHGRAIISLKIKIILCDIRIWYYQNLSTKNVWIETSIVYISNKMLDSCKWDIEKVRTYLSPDFFVW